MIFISYWLNLKQSFFTILLDGHYDGTVSSELIQERKNEKDLIKVTYLPSHCTCGYTLLVTWCKYTLPGVAHTMCTVLQCTLIMDHSYG